VVFFDEIEIAVLSPSPSMLVSGHQSSGLRSNFFNT
jgi:hypothetical protein